MRHPVAPSSAGTGSLPAASLPTAQKPGLACRGVGFLKPSFSPLHHAQECQSARSLIARAKSSSKDEKFAEVNATSVKKDPLKLFAQAQQSMMVLNESRLKALEELKAAQKRISDLQDELDTTRKELEVAQSKIDRQEVQMQSLPQAALAQPKPEVQQAASSAVEPPQELPKEPMKSDLITIRYRTGWQNAFVHFNLNGRGWTTSPGVRMSGDGSEKELILEGTTVEFVVNNGNNDWDTPDPFNADGPKNYRISSPGIYILAHGKIKKQS